MSGLVLELREPAPARIGMGAVTPDRLATLAPRDIGALEVPMGRECVRLDALFRLRSGDPREIVLRGHTGGLDDIGAGMRSGRIRVDGDAGHCVGRDMRGGAIEVRGCAGDYAATGLRAGELRIAGDAGDFLGAALPGERFGMRGGTVFVGGSVGARAGDRQRRGQILIARDAGDYLGARMRAGTIVVLGQAGRCCGFGMRRGTLLLTRPPASLPASFNESGRHSLSFLTVLVRSLHGLGEDWARLDPARTNVLRFVGDLGCDGKGEVLIRL